MCRAGVKGGVKQSNGEVPKVPKVPKMGARGVRGEGGGRGKKQKGSEQGMDIQAAKQMCEVISKREVICA